MIRDRFIFGLAMLWVIAAAVILTILLAIPLFAVEMSIFHLSAIAGLSDASLWHNYLVLMNYLLNPFVGHLAFPDFVSSSNGLKHFAEVKGLFMLTWALVLVLLPAFVIFVKENLRIIFHNGLRVFMIVPLAFGIIAGLIGFDNFFVYFHEILFRDSTWLFDPTLDPIINVLPEQFFMHCFILFGVIYELIFYCLYKKGYSRIRKQKLK